MASDKGGGFLFDVGDGETRCPKCGSFKTTTARQPPSFPHYASFKCHECSHQRWLPKPENGGVSVGLDQTR